MKSLKRLLNNNLDKEKIYMDTYNNINYNFEQKMIIDFLTIVRNGEFYYSQIFPKSIKIFLVTSRLDSLFMKIIQKIIPKNF